MNIDATPSSAVELESDQAALDSHAPLRCQIDTTIALIELALEAHRDEL